MSEVKLNLVDAHNILTGIVHGSVADSTVAALSAEPETIKELEIALSRYIKSGETGEFASFRTSSEIDPTPWDAGLVVIDLAARVVASDSTYLDPGPEGSVYYHDGKKRTDIPISYHLPDDWRFVKSVEAYQWCAGRRRSERQAKAPLDARTVLYGSPMIEFVHGAAMQLRNKTRIPTGDHEQDRETAIREIVQFHATWLTTEREDLRGRSPRDVMLEKQNMIDLDMDSRCLQWSIQSEGPPCLPVDSFAYRYGGFGIHEWIVYYDLVRFLLWTAVEKTVSTASLTQIKNEWLVRPYRDYDRRTPANIIDNERRRLPITATAEEIMLDEDCECCRMMAMETEVGFGPTFWHLDTSNMEEEFAFSTCLTRQEWEAETREREEFDRQWEIEREARRQAMARGELVDDELWVNEAFDE